MNGIIIDCRPSANPISPFMHRNRGNKHSPGSGILYYYIFNAKNAASAFFLEET